MAPEFAPAIAVFSATSLMRRRYSLPSTTLYSESKIEIPIK